MKAIEITAPARRDIDSLLNVSRVSFGEAAADRYRGLLFDGLILIRTNPAAAATTSLDHLRHGVRALHLRQIKSAVRTPRHRLAYTVRNDTVILLRVIHDSMDLESALR